jgi:hypothetical protein
MAVLPVTAERGMLDLSMHGGLARCCAAGCGWEGVPTYIDGKPSTRCPSCETEPDAAIEAELDAEAARRAMPKVGRNEPCFCGSGRKFKKCCGA